MCTARPSWAENPVKVKLEIDWQVLGFDKSKVRIYAPEVENFQSPVIFEIDQGIPIEPKKGWLIIVEEKY